MDKLLSINRRKLLVAGTGTLIGMAGCSEPDPNQADPNEAAPEPDMLVVDGWQLLAVEATGGGHELECVLNIRNKQTYSVSSSVQINVTVGDTEYQTKDEVGVKSGSTAEFSYVLGDGEIPEDQYHLMKADSASVNLIIKIGDEDRVNEDSKGEIDRDQ